MAIAENPSLMMRLWEVHVKVFSRLVTDRLTSARDGQTDGTLSKSPLEETTGSYKRSTAGSDRPLYVFPAAAHSAALATGDLPVQDHSFKISRSRATGSHHASAAAPRPWESVLRRVDDVKILAS